MTSPIVTRATDWCSAFIPGHPPEGLTEKQGQALMQLGTIHNTRNAKTATEILLQAGSSGSGWRLLARPTEFEKLLGIVGAILANDYKPLADYRDEPQP